jgi:hypothetical protein
MSAEDLQAQFDAACLSGDFEAQERLGPLVHPEPGASPPAPAPPADPPRAAPTLSATEFSARQHVLLVEMGMANPGSPRGVALQAELEALLKAQFGEGPASPAVADEAVAVADQVVFPPGTAEPVQVGMRSLVAAENLPAAEIQRAIREIHQARPMDPAAARRALEAEYGDRLPTVLRMADETHATLPPGLQQAIEAQGLFSSPIVVRWLDALRAWRQGGRGRG